MRPHRLVLRGFRSFADETTIDFAGRSLVGVAGPIGSGKSTLLDAVAFSLYGQTPTVGKQTKSLINQRQDSAHVEMWFGVADETWRAVRALRRKGQSAHSLEKYSAVDGDRLELIEGEKAVNAKVAELLGLDFHAFGRSAMLAQNQFARFLDATGGERDAVLKGVFGLDRIEAVRDIAKARRDAASRDLEELDRRRADVETDRAALAAATEELEPATTAVAAFEKAAKVEAKLTALANKNADDKIKAEAAVADLAALASRLPSRTETATLLAASLADAEDIAVAEKALAKATREHTAAADGLAEVILTTGDREALARLEADVAKLAEFEGALADSKKTSQAAAAAVDASAAEVVSADKALADVAAKATEAAEEISQRAVAVKAAQAALHGARHDEMAAALRSEIGRGDACPVCGQEIAKLPAAVRPASLRSAEKALESASRLETKAEAARTVVQQALTAATAAAAGTRVRVEEVTAALQARAAESAKLEKLHGKALAKVTESLGKTKPEEALARRRQALTKGEEALVDNAANLAAAQASLARSKAASDERRTAMQQLATEVAALGGTLGASLPSGADRKTLGEALDRLREVWETKAAAAEDAVKEGAKKLEATQRDKAQLHQELGIDVEADFSEALVAVKAALATAKGKVAMLEERVARVAVLEKENVATVARLALYTRLSDDLAPSRFVAFLLDEERVALAGLAAERFEMLSGGRYRFSEDGSFDVVDLTAADAIRKPRSLSGGETFLASLALALALAEMVSRSGGRLGAFFLDEGFGSLDAEHLDLAMEGVERIIADDDDRLVVIVSHVPELRQRMEDVIELDKHAVTGDTVVIRN
ncbi:MAG: SMC family ATPase [Acidimicrobiia bacterium]|nr:SMC family ATPase [Acidimicrobiia bacterium]